MGEREADSGKIQVAATVFPYYDFVRQIGGGLVDVELVIPAGMDSHSFEPTPADMRVLQEADIVIANGGAMEHWVTQSLDALDSAEMTVAYMMDYVDTVEEEIVEGMEEEEHGHNHEEGQGSDSSHGKQDAGEDAEHNDPDAFNEDGHEEEIEYDEHIWTSPVNAMEITKVITDILIEKDPVHAAEYRAGRDAYLEELTEIHQGFLEVAENEKRNMIVVGDKFPFRYLADEYGFHYRAAFSGCSTDTEPSARTIAYLIDKVREGNLPAVYYLELSSRRVSEIIGEETGAEPMLLHSCHNVSRTEFDGGITYADLMRQNIENLRKGLDE